MSVSFWLHKCISVFSCVFLHPPVQRLLPGGGNASSLRVRHPRGPHWWHLYRFPDGGTVCWGPKPQPHEDEGQRMGNGESQSNSDTSLAINPNIKSQWSALYQVGISNLSHLSSKGAFSILFFFPFLDRGHYRSDSKWMQKDRGQIWTRDVLRLRPPQNSFP